MFPTGLKSQVIKKYFVICLSQSVKCNHIPNNILRSSKLSLLAPDLLLPVNTSFARFSFFSCSWRILCSTEPSTTNLQTKQS